MLSLVPVRPERIIPALMWTGVSKVQTTDKGKLFCFPFAAAPSDYDQGEWRMKIRLIATDMDGTFLDDEKQIPEANWQALLACAARGIQIVPATGRTVRGDPRQDPDAPGSPLCHNHQWSCGGGSERGPDHQHLPDPGGYCFAGIGNGQRQR